MDTKLVFKTTAGTRGGGCFQIRIVYM